MNEGKLKKLRARLEIRTSALKALDNLLNSIQGGKSGREQRRELHRIINQIRVVFRSQESSLRRVGRDYTSEAVITEEPNTTEQAPTNNSLECHCEHRGALLNESVDPVFCPDCLHLLSKHETGRICYQPQEKPMISAPSV